MMASMAFTVLVIGMVVVQVVAVESTNNDLSVFEKGPYTTNNKTVNNNRFEGEKPPPRSLFIVFPTQRGTYPVILFFHGFILHNTYYTSLLHHIASHGFIVVAPQLLKDQIGISQWQEIRCAGAVADWMHGNLELNLPILPDLSLVALAGHSRGGKTAFALALGLSEATQKFCALIGIDPVAGNGIEMEPQILNHQPKSFNISIPTAVIGMGLPYHPCAPDGMNHVEFYDESKPTRAYFVAKDYGHMDALDLPSALKPVFDLLCWSGKGDEGALKRSVGGIMVAFLNASFNGHTGDLAKIVSHPSLAPVTLQPVRYEPRPSLPSQSIIFSS